MEFLANEQDTRQVLNSKFWGVFKLPVVQCRLLSGYSVYRFKILVLGFFHLYHKWVNLNFKRIQYLEKRAFGEFKPRGKSSSNVYDRKLFCEP